MERNRDRKRNRKSALSPAGFVPITRKGRIGEAAAWAIAVIAWCISYGTQVALAIEHGFHGPEDWEAAGMGATSDLLSLACMMIALDQAERGKSTPLAWLLSVAAALMMEWANIVYAGRDIVAIILHAWPPAVAVSVVFLLVHVRKENARIADVSEPDPEPPPTPPRVSAPVRLVEAMGDLLSKPGARALSDHQLGVCLGISADDAGRLREVVMALDAAEAGPEPKPPLPPPPSSASSGGLPVAVSVELPAEPEPQDAAEPKVVAEPKPEVAPVAGEAPTGARRNGRREHPVTLKEAKSEYRKLAAKGNVTGSALGAALEVSDVMGRIWKRKVEAEAEPKTERNPSFRFQGAAA